MDLFQCAKIGDLNGVKQLIQQGIDINAANASGQTALYLACEGGHYDVVNFLLENKARVNNAKPVFVAAREGHAQCVDLLLKFGADVGFKFFNARSDNKGESTESVPTVEKMNISVILTFIDHHVMLYIPLESIVTKLTELFSHDNAEDNGIELELEMVHKILSSGCLIVKSDRFQLDTGVRFALKHVSRKKVLDVLSQHTDLDIVKQFFSLAVYHSVKNNWCDILEDLLKRVSYVNAIFKSKCTPLRVACEYSCGDIVPVLLKYGADPNLESVDPSVMDYDLSDRFGTYRSKSSTPLSVACEKGDISIVKALLSSGADPNLGRLDQRPLKHACERGRHTLVKMLLEHGADVHTPDKHGNSPLHYTLIRVSEWVSQYSDDLDRISILHLLLDHGADTNAVSSSGVTPLYMACQRGRIEIVEKMLKCGAQVDASKTSLLYAACSNNHVAVVELLLREGVDPNPDEEGLFPLHIAAANCNSELVTLLLSHGANADAVDDSDGYTALHDVVNNGRTRICSTTDKLVFCHNDIVNALLCAGADANHLNSKGKTPLYLAVAKGVVDLVDILLSHGANPTIPTRYMLSRACDRQNVKVEIVEKLLKAGADPNQKIADAKGKKSLDKAKCDIKRPALCIAARRANCEVATLLLKYGADVNMSSVDNQSALHFAVSSPFHVKHRHYRKADLQRNAMSMVKLLLEHGADVNQSAPGRPSPFHSLLDEYSEVMNVSNFTPSRLIWKRQVICDMLLASILNGACVNDPRYAVDSFHCAVEASILKTLCAWCPADHLPVEFLKLGAGFKLLAYVCKPRCKTILCSGSFYYCNHAKSIRLCQAAVMAGYVPSTKEIEFLQQSRKKVVAELLSWLNEDRQRVPSLMRLCRVAIRRQLSIASCNRTILPAIDQLQLPSELEGYLKFEGCLTEVDLKVGVRDTVDESDDSTYDDAKTSSESDSSRSETDSECRSTCSSSKTEYLMTGEEYENYVYPIQWPCPFSPSPDSSDVDQSQSESEYSDD